MGDAMSAGTVGLEREVEMKAAEFKAARRVHRALTAGVEKRVLQWMAERLPGWVSSDHLTALGLAAQMGAGLGYALARYRRGWLWVVMVCVVLNWFGDSMDGTLARVRARLGTSKERPRYGFYVDHVVDVLGATAMMCGLGASGLVHWEVAAAMLVGFLLLASESYLATHTLGRFEMSQGMFGPTEIRILLIAGNVALLRNPWAHVLGHRWLLFDVGGVIASVGMLGMLLVVTARHAAQLYRAEPLLRYVEEPLLHLEEPLLRDGAEARP
jgi:archaetidylinositol phosphate synthase